MNKIGIGFCAALAAFTGTAGAQPYRVMDVSRESLQAIDSNTIMKSGAVASVWIFTHYWKPQSHGKSVMVQAKSRVEFDCLGNRMRLTAMHFFADRETPIPSGDDRITPWNAIVPDAWLMSARNAACDGTYTSMGKMAWDDYDLMVSSNRDIAERAFLPRK